MNEAEVRSALSYLQSKGIVKDNGNKTYSLTKKAKEQLAREGKLNVKAYIHTLLLLSEDFLTAEDVYRYVRVMKILAGEKKVK